MNSSVAVISSNMPAYNVVLEMNNSDLSGTDYVYFRHPLYMIVTYSVAYALIMVFALVGNIMVVVTVCRNQSMHTVTNYFIVNLAIADIMVALICLPMTLLSNLYIGWHFGLFMCKATPYLQGVSVCASVNTLAAIAVDKYIAICHLTQRNRINKKYCKIIILFIWICASAIMVPWAIYFKIGHILTGNQLSPICFEMWPLETSQRSFFLGAIFLCCYSIPLVLIVFCYFLIGLKVWRRRAPGVKNTSFDVIHKSKVKALKMLAIVVILFAFSWLPLYVVKIYTMFHGQDITLIEAENIRGIIIPISQWLGSSNSGMNPIIYVFFSKRYRQGFKDTIISCYCTNRQNAVRRRAFATALATHSYGNGNTAATLVYDKNTTQRCRADIMTTSYV